MGKIKIMIVDDSLMVRKVLSDIIKTDPKLELIGVASNGRLALMKIPTLKPDVITLDVMMPDMDGLSTLKEIMTNYPTKVIMVSSHTTEGAKETIKALELGAADFISKPAPDKISVDDMAEQLLTKIHALAKSDWKIKRPAAPKPKPIEKKIVAPTPSPGTPAKKIVAIGISTGGPAALKEIFQQPLDPQFAYLIVQHMPASFTPQLAERLNTLSNLSIKEAEHNDIVLAGQVYIAPGDKHMEVIESSNKLKILASSKEKVSGHRPSADALFFSITRTNFVKKCIAIIMTGMGRDGATGIGLIRKKGGITLAQDQESSVVFGMNREAIQEGAIDKIVPLDEIVPTIHELSRTL